MRPERRWIVSEERTDPGYVENLWTLVVSLSGVVTIHMFMSMPMQNSQRHLYTLAEAVSELDQILCAGGPLPSRWAKHWQRGSEAV